MVDRQAASNRLIHKLVQTISQYMYIIVFGKYIDNLVHAQSVCTSPFLRCREGPGDEVKTDREGQGYWYKHMT